VGVPEIMPVEELRLNPSGRVPVFMVYVGVNPAETVGAAVVPAELTEKVLAAKEIVGLVTVREKEENPVPDPLVALIITVKSPVWVGVPEIIPVPAAHDMPWGNPIAV